MMLAGDRIDEPPPVPAQSGGATLLTTAACGDVTVLDGLAPNCRG